MTFWQICANWFACKLTGHCFWRRERHWYGVAEISHDHCVRCGVFVLGEGFACTG